MEVIPSIDLKGGRCVRLYQGDYAKETVFSEDPRSIASKWDSPGVARLHIVDLDGAAKGALCHLETIRQIVKAVKIPLQVGGGVRTMEAIERLRDAGVQRVILGTAAVENPELVKEACQVFGEAIVLGVDARDGFVAVRGWKDKTSVLATDMIARMEALGARRFIYTDVARDGTLTEPNFQAISELMASARSPIIASGGVTSVAHLIRLSQLGVEGAIIGRALYTGDILLDKALAALKDKARDS